MDNKKLIISFIAGLVVVVGGILFISSSKKTAVPVQQTQNIAPEDAGVSSIKPEAIGLSLTASTDQKKVILEVANTQGISGLDYELSYISKGDIPRGVIGHIDIKIAGKPVIQEITLGTCSDVCHYDQDVSDIKLVLKVAKTDGTTSQVEQSLEL
ncbi:MAG: hypothetical protein Q7R51_02025 [bacterium]|nr:hypothetical protein [bacterium]